MKTIEDLIKELRKYTGNPVVIEAEKVRSVYHAAETVWKDNVCIIKSSAYFTRSAVPVVFKGILRELLQDPNYAAERYYILIEGDNGIEKVPIGHSLIAIKKIIVEISETEKKSLEINYISF